MIQRLRKFNYFIYILHRKYNCHYNNIPVLSKFYIFHFSKPTVQSLKKVVFSFPAVSLSLLGFTKKDKMASAGLNDLITLADKLNEDDKTEEAYTKLKEAEASDDAQFKSPEIYYRLGRFGKSLSGTYASDAEKKKTYTYEAFEYVKKGLALDPEHANCNKWMGILLDLTARFEGTKKRIENSYLVKDHLTKAINANPKDAVTLHCMGVWCFEFADLPWLQQKLAAAFFASPPTSTYDDALKYLLEAEEVDPNFYSSNLLYIGKSYLRQGKKPEAKDYFDRVINFKGDSHDDQESRKEATNLIKKC